MKLRADFHIHSCLSPCGNLEMSPSAIVARAKEVGLNALGLADHNCTLNCPAFEVLCRNAGIHALFGAEVTTMEEGHVLCLFDQLDAAMSFGEEVYARLMDVPNNPDRFGDQVHVNENDEIEGFPEKLLIGATDISIDELAAKVHGLGGLFIPSHVDRQAYSIERQLGFLPPEPYDAIEISPRGLDSVSGTTYRGYPFITNSDAHQLEQLGCVYTEIEVEEFSVAAIREALAANRKAICHAK
ncbi:PHP-associated domain-containing protein [Verrucomicrobiota bacterium]